MNIAQHFQAQSSARPHTTALIDTRHGRSRTMTFAELEAASAHLAARLQHAGLCPGDVVLVLLPLSAELVLTFNALFRLGLVAMLIDPAAGRQSIEQCCSLFAPRALIADSKTHLLRLVSPALRHIPAKFATDYLPLPGTISLARPADLPPHHESMSLHPAMPALVSFADSSTSEPQPRVYSHSLLLEQCRVLAHNLHMVPETVDLATRPLTLLANLAHGVTSLIPAADLHQPEHINPAPLITVMRAYQASSISASPLLLERLADYCATYQITLPHMRRIFAEGIPVLPHLLEQLHTLAPRAEIAALYSTTEAEPITRLERGTLQATDLHMMVHGAGLLVGKPIDDIQVRILPDQWGQPIKSYTAAEFAARCCAAGETGEIVVSGSYLLPPAANGQQNHQARFLVDGIAWQRTGEAGYLDAQGRLWLLGRCDTRIEDTRGALYPLAVECAARLHPAIAQAAVASFNGQRVLTIECREGTQPVEIGSLRAHLAWARLDDICYYHCPVPRQQPGMLATEPALPASLQRG
jgi:acyl-CoA synthetase (AMP-forming)/AMP-acid ligase II